MKSSAQSTARRDDLARRFFRAEEVAALASCGPGQQRDRFYDLWTLGESAVKAPGWRGVGSWSRGFQSRSAVIRHPDATVR
ncbi:MAG: 4-phosphopantetheinyl transferase family protein [Haliea sp.]|nr:4-phosphopantetheinyl transferase family protein [Haliea sp.]